VAPENDGEGGYAMILAIILSGMLMVMTIGMLGTGVHLQGATAKDASWNDSLRAAEAGVDRAVYELTKSSSYVGTGSGVMTVAGGEAQVLVDAPAAGSVTIYSTGWSPSRAAGNASHRRIKVAFGAADSFNFALFSTTGLSVKNNGVTHGDVFANNSILLESNSTVYGSVTSATGTVELQNNAMIRKETGRLGNVYTGGYDPAGSWGLTMSNGSVVEGNAYAQAETCPGISADDSRYNIVASGSILGSASARGTISGSVTGTRTPYNCQLRAATRSLPQYTWDPSLYTSPQTFSTLASFQTWVNANQGNLTGVVRLWDPACASGPSDAANVVNMNGATVTGNFVMVSNCRIDANNDFTVTAPSSKIVNLIVQNASTSPAAVTIKNNFTVTNDAAVLVYSTGLIDVKNNIDDTGAVYAGAISIKNNMQVDYDPRVERSLGFGDLKYARQSWQECVSSTTGTGC
jgi:hypothetical protein